MKTLLTFTEIEIKIDILKEELEDLTSWVESLETSGKPTKVANKMISSRRNELTELSESKLVHKSKTSSGLLDLNELTFTDDMEDSIIFLTGRFKSGHFIGFWTHSPCSTCEDTEKGWAIIDPERLEIIERCSTKTSGVRDNNFREWQKTLKPRFGKMNILHDGINTNTPVWKMSDI